jgi:sec-independent protein translocase protein TatA
MSEPLLAIAFGFWEILLVLGVLVMTFGARKLPMIARGLGQGIRNFKGEIEPPEDDEDDR